MCLHGQICWGGGGFAIKSSSLPIKVLASASPFTPPLHPLPPELKSGAVLAMTRRRVFLGEVEAGDLQVDDLRWVGDRAGMRWRVLGDYSIGMDKHDKWSESSVGGSGTGMR